MKVKKLLLGASLLLSSFGMSQGYSFSVSTEAYTDLTGATSLNQGAVWDDPEFAIPLGFDFTFFTTNYSNFYITNDGLGGMLYDQPLPVTSANIAFLIPFGADIIDRGYASGVSESDISYKIEGTAGNKIAKIQWKNVGFYGDVDDDDVSTDFTNFQMWLYEADGTIELRFGPTSVTQPNISYEGETGSFITFIPTVDYNTYTILEDGFILTGNPSSPNFSVMDDLNNATSLSGTIADQTVYTFSNNLVSVEEEVKLEFSLYPNPASDFIHLKLNEEKLVSLKVVNSLGEVVIENQNPTLDINIEGLESGVYFVSVETQDGSATQRFVKK